MIENEKTEIMIEIKDEELPVLADIYKPYENELPQVYSFILTCIKAKKMGKSDFVTLMSPKGCWCQDGTFFALMPQHGHDIFVHSLDDSGKNVIDGILNTQKFKFPPNQERPYTMFFAIHEIFFSKIEDILTNHLHLELLFSDTYTIYSLEKEKALKTIISLPPDIYIKEIGLSKAHIVNSVWTTRYSGSEKKLVNLLELNNGYGVYLKSNDQLVSWITLSCLGQLATLHTLEGHEKKGYGSLITKYMCKKLAEKGFNSFATVSVGNRPSENLFKKLGFRKLGLCKYTGVQIL